MGNSGNKGGSLFQTRRWQTACVVLALALFWADFHTPLGFAHGSLYIFPLLMAALSRQFRFLYTTAGLAIVLVLAGFFVSPPGLALRYVLLNRILSIGEILLLTGLCSYVIRQLTQIQASHQQLDKTQTRLDEQSQLLEIAGKTINLGGWRVDLPERTLLWSDGVRAIHGVSKGTTPSLEEAIGFYEPQCRAQIEQAFTACVEQGLPYDMEVRLRRTDGRIINVRSIGQARRDASGCIVGVQGAILDVTADKEKEARQQKLEQETQQLHQRLFNTLEHISDAFFTLDSHWHITYLNGAAERLLECQRETLLGHKVWDEFPEAERFRQQYELAFSEQRSVEFIEHYAPLGKWFEVRVYPSPDGLAIYFRDVTARLQTEERLHNAVKMEALGQLTGGVAHDFNNLLTVILGNAELLRESLAGDSRLSALADMTQNAAERAAQLTQHLLAFARRQALDPQIIDIRMCLDGIQLLLRQSLKEDIDIKLVHETGLWSALVDAAQLESAILNLALNAQDAMPQGGRLTIETRNATLDQDIAVQFSDVQSGDYVLIAMSDSGQGIPKEALGKVFDPFFTTKDTGKGSGLGLSMVYGFVKQSNGHIRIYSEVGEGTTVRLYLPRADSASKQEHLETKIEAVGRNERILLVEDDAMVRQYAEQVLRDLGYEVSTAANGGEALDILRSDRPLDLLFTDIIMPGGINGRQLADQAQALRPGLKVLFTSGYTEDAVVHHGRLDPGVHLLGKPYLRKDLARQIRQLLDEQSD